MLFQREYWWDRFGRRHRVADMPLAYLLNVLNFLEGRAQRYYAVDRYLRAVWCVFSSDEPFGPRDAVAWIRRTPLWDAVSTQAAARVFDDPFRVEPSAGI